MQRLPKAHRQAHERHQGDVQGAGFDLLEVLPVHIGPFSGFLQGPVGGMTKGSHPSAKGALLLLEPSRSSVRLGRSLGLG